MNTLTLKVIGSRLQLWASLVLIAAHLTGMLVAGACVAGTDRSAAPTLVSPYRLPARLVVSGAIPESEFIHEHLSAQQEQATWSEIRRSVAMLRSQSVIAAPDTALAVTYVFPVRMAPGLPEYAGFRVSAFADHNPAAAQVLDYSGGTRTYDGHSGTDIALWPFAWNKVDAGAVQVVAAAAGTIAYKANVDPTDHNPCDGGSANDNWNFIGVVHSDGRLTFYGHMRYNSLTSKVVGQTVAQGEYLGTVASSGNSGGPHVHFEARYGSFSNAEWIDPYAGPASQPESLWTSQRPYFDSAINRLATHSSPASTANACALTITNLQDSFATLQNVFFYAYFRDSQGALPAQLKLYRPDGSVFQTWQYTTGTVFSSGSSAAWVANLPVDAPSGTWRFEAIYNSQTYETYFNVNAPTAITVASPNGGEQWQGLQPHSIIWADNLGGEVNIELYRNNVYVGMIVSNTPSDGSYLWTPDAALNSGSGYSVRITSVTNPSVQDASDAPFTLSEAQPLFANGFE